jgi:hypothetical protein
MEGTAMLRVRSASSLLGRVVNASCRVAAGAVVVTAPAGLKAQEVTVSGVVVESTRGATVAGATVRLGDQRSFFTDLDGAFHFTKVPAGLHVMAVEAYGYRSRTLSLDLGSDTTLRIELEPAPIELDTLAVDIDNVTVRGTVRDAKTNVPILVAQLLVYPGGRTVGATSGRFTLENVPARRPITLVVEAMEYLPVRLSLVPEGDTTLAIPLQVDSVALRMVQQQVQRLEVRAKAMPVPLTALNREDLERHVWWNVLDVIRRATPAKLPTKSIEIWGRRSCYFLDDSNVTLDVFQGLRPEQVERIEVFGRGSMIRVYTRRYVHRLMREGRLTNAGYITGLGPVICR